VRFSIGWSATSEGDSNRSWAVLDHAAGEAHAELTDWLADIEAALTSNRFSPDSRSRWDPEWVNGLASLAALEG
jgi:hypothetical protein